MERTTIYDKLKDNIMKASDRILLILQDEIAYYRVARSGNHTPPASIKPSGVHKNVIHIYIYKTRVVM